MAIAGDWVVVFEDPHTEQKPEGDAELIELMQSDQWDETRNLERWSVRFFEEDEVVTRAILVPRQRRLP